MIQTPSKQRATRATRATALIDKGKSGSPEVEVSGLPGLPDQATDGAVIGGAANPTEAPPTDDALITEAPPALTDCPCWRVYLDWWRDPDGNGKKPKRPGVYYHGIGKDDDKNDVRTNTWICGPLILEATTHCRRGESFGRLLRIQDSRGRWHEWNMPMHMLGGDCSDLRRELLALGLVIAWNQRVRIPEYLMHRPPKRIVIAALSLGWHDRSFVFPDEIIGDGDIRYQSESATPPDFDCRGTLDGWKDSVSALMRGNELGILCVSTAFAAPMMDLVNIDSLGAHLFGDSSAGKTTLVRAAVSVFGSPSMLRTWRSTANGMEAIAAESTDTLLALDEIGQANGREIGQIVYSLANGVGKSRATVKGTARRTYRWRAAVLSTGEKTIEAHMAADGSRYHAGQDVRLLNIPVGSREYGIFDSLNGLPSGAHLSDAIKQATKEHYGTVGRAFVRFLIENEGTDYRAMVDALVDKMPATTGQERRAANQFALIGVAGELATKAGITGWGEGAAASAAVSAYKSWAEHRGSGIAETRKILDQVRDFIDRHGDSRFDARNAASNLLIRDRAGYTEIADGRTIYLFTPGGFKEAINGFDQRRALNALEEAGWLVPRPGGKRQLQRKIDGRNAPFYGVKLPDEGGDADQEAA